MTGKESGPVEVEAVECQMVIWKPKFKTLGFAALAWNNSELSGTTLSQCILGFDRALMKPGNKTHSWVLNSLLPEPVQGAGDD